MRYIAFIIMFVVLISAEGCKANQGIHWTYDGARHTFSWGAR